MQTLKEVAVGKTVSVVKLHGEGAVKRRIMDMGITKGTQIFVRKVAPLGDPVEVTVRGYELSLRKEDAQMDMSDKRTDYWVYEEAGRFSLLLVCWIERDLKESPEEMAHILFENPLRYTESSVLENGLRTEKTKLSH